MAYDPNDPNMDWQAALQMLQAQPQAQAQPQQQSNTWSQALDTIQKYQSQNAPAARAAPAAEAPPEKEGTFGPSFWAMALDVLGNNGKDLGGILSQSADNYNKRLSGWEARNSPDAKLDRELKMAQLAQADRAPQHEAFQEAGQLAEGMRGDRQLTNQENQFTQGQQQARALKQAEMLAHHGDEVYSQQGMNSRQAQQIAAENARSANTIGAEGSRQAIGIDAENARAQAQRENQLAIAGMSAANKVKAPITDAKVIDPARVASLTDAERTKADEAVGLGRSINDKLHILHDLQLAPPSSANEKTYTNTINFLVGNASAVGNTGIVNKDEYLRYMQNLPPYAAVKTPQGKLAQVTSARSGMEVLRGRNPSVEALSQIQSMFARQAQESMRGYGYTDDLPGFDAKKKEAPPVQAPPPVQAAPIQTQQIQGPDPKYIDESRANLLGPNGNQVMDQLSAQMPSLPTTDGRGPKVSKYMQTLQGDDELRKLGMSF